MSDEKVDPYVADAVRAMEAVWDQFEVLRRTILRAERPLLEAADFLREQAAEQAKRGRL